MSEAEVQPETPETPAVPEKPKRKPAKAETPAAEPVVDAPVEAVAEVVPAAIADAALDLAPFHAYKAQHPRWGVLHCAIHDGSLDDEGVARARQDARMQRDAEAVALADLLAAMSEPERRALREVLK